MADDTPPPLPDGYQMAARETPPALPKGYQLDLREQYKEAIRRGDENYPGTKIPVPGTLDLLQRRMSDPFGVQDELVGAGAYLGARVHNLFDYRGDDQRDPDQAYMQAAERIRAEKEMARERLGWGPTLAADVVGGFGTTGAAGLTGGAASYGSALGNWLTSGSRAAQAAKGGTLFGTVSGAANAEGGLADRAIGAAEGAGTGAVLGPAISEVGIPVVSALGRSGYNALANPSAVPGNVGNALYGAGAATSNALRRVIPGASANIDDTILRALARQGMTPADAAAQMAADMRASIINGVPVNPPVALADSGPAMRELAYTVKAQPGEAKTLAERVLEGRQRGENGFDSQYQRMKEGTQSALTSFGENAAQLEDALNASRSAASNAAYDAYRNADVTIPVQDILQQHAADTAQGLTTNSALGKDIDKAYAPFIQERYKPGGLEGPSLVEDAQHNLKIMGLDKRIADAQEAGNASLEKQLTDLKTGLEAEHQARSKAAEELTPQQFDNAKKQLDDQIETAIRGGDKYKASILTDLKSRLVSRADEATIVKDSAGNPVLDASGNPTSLYKNARQAFQAPTKTLEALEAGKGITKTDIDRVATDFAKLTPEQQRAYRIGAASDLTERFGNKNTGNNIPLQLDTPNIQTRLGAVAGQPSLDQLNALREIETRMFQTRNRVMGGSKTAENQQNLNEATLDAATSAAQKLMQGRPLAAAGHAIGKTLQYVYRFREEDAAALARDLFATDPAARRATIARLEKAYGAPKVQQAVNAATQLAMRSAATSTVAPVVGNMLSTYRDTEPRNALLRRY